MSEPLRDGIPLATFHADQEPNPQAPLGSLSSLAFGHTVSQTENKHDLFEALNEGKIILASTAEDVLKEEGSQLFGSFFLAVQAQAALGRSTIREKETGRTLCRFPVEPDGISQTKIRGIPNSENQYSRYCPYLSKVI